MKELRERRPLVREKEASVLRPGAPPKQMELKVKEGKPVEREIEKFRGRKPAEGGAKPREFRPPEKGVEKPRDRKPPEGEVEKRERKQLEKGN